MTPLGRLLSRHVPARFVSVTVCAVYAVLLFLTIALVGYGAGGGIVYLDI